MKAIVLNKAAVYYLFTQAIILGNTTYKDAEQKVGIDEANKLLTDTLMVFRRQVKHNKMGLRISGSKVFVTKENLELFDYLANLFNLIRETGSANTFYQKNHEFEQQLVKGPGFRKLYEMKDSILNALHSFGCKEQEDKEEIFDQSLLVFWKKLSEGEVGIFLVQTTQSRKTAGCLTKSFTRTAGLALI